MKSFTNNLLKYKKTKYVLAIFVLLLLLIGASLILKPSEKSKVKSLIPITPSSVPTIGNVSIIPDSNPINSQQIINFNWNNLNPSIPSSIANYKIVSPLINKNTIFKLAENLGFSTTNRVNTLKDTSYMWKTDVSGIFASIDQNQIFYQKYSIPQHLNNITKEDAIKIADLKINLLFGESFFNSLDKNKSVRFLNLLPGIYDAQNINNPTKANLIEIGYRQVIDSFPVVALSGSTNTINVIIDTEKNLYKIDLYGGFSDISKQENIPLISFNELKRIAPQKSRRISNVSSVSLENAFLKAPNLNVSVESIKVGYFQRNDNALFPAFIILGTMSGNNLPDTYVELLVPAAKD